MAIVSRREGRSLDQMIRFERLFKVGENDTGSDIEAWRPLVTCYAAVDGTKASERYVGGEGARSVGDYTVWIRADILTRFKPTPKDRIVWGARILNIIDIPDQQLRGRFIAVFANSGLNEG